MGTTVKIMAITYSSGPHREIQETIVVGITLMNKDLYALHGWELFLLFVWADNPNCNR